MIDERCVEAETSVVDEHLRRDPPRVQPVLQNRRGARSRKVELLNDHVDFVLAAHLVCDTPNDVLVRRDRLPARRRDPLTRL